MPFYRKTTTANPLRKYTAKSKRKRVNNVTRTRYQRPTARNQQKQIMANARVINKLNRAVFGNRIFCDWQEFGTMNTNINPQGSFTRTWFCAPLTNFPSWNPVLRADQNVIVSSTTYVQRLQLNLRMLLQQSNYAYYNIFVVTLRKDQNARDTPLDISNGQDPVALADWIDSPSGANIRLNSAIWKVHYASYRTLTETTLGEAAPSPPLTAGNPDTTWGKAQVNLPVKIKVRRPQSGEPWKNTGYMNLPYNQRYQLLVEILQQSPATTTQNRAARLDWDVMATTINDT